MRGESSTRGDAPTVGAPTEAVAAPVAVPFADPPALLMRRPDAGGDGPVSPVASPSAVADGRRPLVCGDPRLPEPPPATPAPTPTPETPPSAIDGMLIAVTRGDGRRGDAITVNGSFIAFAFEFALACEYECERAAATAAPSSAIGDGAAPAC